MSIYTMDVAAIYWTAVCDGAGWPVADEELGDMVRPGEVAVYEARDGGYIVVGDLDGRWGVRL